MYNNNQNLNQENNQQGYVPNNMYDTSYQQYNPQNMYYNQPNQDYNMQNYYTEHQMQVNQQIIAQQQQQIQQLMQQQQYMQANQKVNQQIPVQQYGTQKSFAIGNFDLSKLYIRNKMSPIAALIFFCSFFFGNMMILWSSPYSIKETCKMMKQYMPFSKGFDGIKLWFASNLMNLIIASIVILLISSIINVGHLRQIVLVITSICFFFALVVMGEDARPGFSVLLILAGIIAGFASCAEDLKAPKKEFEPVTDYAKDILDKGGWVCNECGKVNPKYLTTCKCGNSKPS